MCHKQKVDLYRQKLVAILVDFFFFLTQCLRYTLPDFNKHLKAAFAKKH